jgi:DNA-binding response OmpR family regulator
MRKILILDDEPNLTKLIALILKDEGFEVETKDVTLGHQALIDSIDPSEYEAVFCDYLLGNLDGGQVLQGLDQALKERGQISTKLILMSAINPSPEIFSVILSLGGSFLKKPFSRDDLTACLPEKKEQDSLNGLEL